MATVTLFGRPGCHLCELLAEQLEPLCRAAGLVLVAVNVDDDPGWQARYGTRIPVACLGERELTGWPMDAGRVRNLLRGHSPV